VVRIRHTISFFGKYLPIYCIYWLLQNFYLLQLEKACFIPFSETNTALFPTALTEPHFVSTDPQFPHCSEFYKLESWFTALSCYFLPVAVVTYSALK